MKWSEHAWAAIEPIYSEILVLPFIHELINGRLEKEKFTFYIQQDAIYLAEFGRVLSAIAAKLDGYEHVASFLHFAKDTMQVEHDLHQSIFQTYSVSNLPEASPACLLYTSYLHQQVANAPVERAAAAVLPCFWIYREVGNHIVKNQTKELNPYQQWIDTYGGDVYAAAVDRAIAICDELAASCTEQQRQSMTDAFVLCSKMEWMFWNSAWKLEQWEI